MVPAVVISAFVVAAVPAAVFLAVWAAVTVYRILFPERASRSENAALRRRVHGEAVNVGFREIHEEMRTHERALARSYRPVGGGPCGIPEAWHEDLHRRRN